MSFFFFTQVYTYLLLYMPSQYGIVLLETLYCLINRISNHSQQNLKMTNQELYKQAIADAKNLKDISMAQAKEAIAEAFNPKIQEMFRLKLSELEQDDLKEEDDNMEEGQEHGEDGKMEESEEVNEMTLEEILAELEEGEMEEGEHDLEEMGTGYAHGEQEPSIEEAEEEEEEVEVGEEEIPEEDMEAEEGAEEVAELSVEEFKDLIRDVIADVMSGGAGSEEGMEDLEGGEEEVIGLDEILAELEEDGKMEEVKKKDDSKLKAELHEAIKTINILKNSLNEINLLNAKLLYVNKIFKAKSLTESQKVKVVNAFDRAATTKEAQNIYETLKDSLGETKKQTIKESVGFASKAVGKAPARPIVEAESYVNRLQILAGIKSAY